MKSILAIIIVGISLSLSTVALSEEGHDDHEEHSDHVEQAKNEKGILDANPNRGFRIAPQVIENFGIQTQKLNGAGPWVIPLSARLLSAEEINLYRFREGFFKRIDFKATNKLAGKISVTSADLQAGDEIATGGIGFLRIVELAAFGGVADGHSH